MLLNKTCIFFFPFLPTYYFPNVFLTTSVCFGLCIPFRKDISYYRQCNAMVIVERGRTFWCPPCHCWGVKEICSLSYLNSQTMRYFAINTGVSKPPYLLANYKQFLSQCHVFLTSLLFPLLYAKRPKCSKTSAVQMCMQPCIINACSLRGAGQKS